MVKRKWTSLYRTTSARKKVQWQEFSAVRYWFYHTHPGTHRYHLHKHFTNLICFLLKCGSTWGRMGLEIVEAVVSRKVLYPEKLVSSSWRFLGSMVRPEWFACVFYRESSEYNMVTQCIGSLTFWTAMDEICSKWLCFLINPLSPASAISLLRLTLTFTSGNRCPKMFISSILFPRIYRRL